MEWHYGVEECCTTCKATKHGTTLNMADARDCAPWNKPENMRTLDDYVVSLQRRFPDPAHWNPLTQIIGFNIQGFFEDQLRCDCLGVRQHANASCLLTLAKHEKWGPLPLRGDWGYKLDTVLSEAYNDFSRWCLTNGEENTQQVFKCLNLSMHKRSDFPILKSKGRNSVVVTKWLMKVAEGCQDSRDVVSMFRYSLLWGLDMLWNIPHDCRPRFVLTEEELEQLAIARKSALLSFYALHHIFSTKGESLFNITFKFHQCDHMRRRQIRSKLACWLFRCFASEHSIGSVARVAGATHGASTNRRAVQRFICLFWGTKVAP